MNHLLRFFLCKMTLCLMFRYLFSLFGFSLLLECWKLNMGAVASYFIHEKWDSLFLVDFFRSTNKVSNFNEMKSLRFGSFSRLRKWTRAIFVRVLINLLINCSCHKCLVKPHFLCTKVILFLNCLNNKGNETELTKRKSYTSKCSTFFKSKRLKFVIHLYTLMKMDKMWCFFKRKFGALWEFEKVSFWLDAR